MNFINKLERKFGKYAIRNLSMYVVAGYVIGYIISLMSPTLYRFLLLEPKLVLQGQVWRIFTWVLTPPERLNIWSIIMIIFYYSIGSSLEREWGAFRYNLYLLTGILTTVLGVMIVYLFMGGAMLGSELASTYYINMSIFLAYAATYPNHRVYLYFILPIKVKWLGILYGLSIVASLISSGNITRVLIVTSLLNFIIYFLGSRNLRPVSPKEVQRKRSYRREVVTSSSGPRHKCAICGRTEQDDENLEFRYCSKCDGNHEYCQDHLFSHTHIKG